MLDIAKMDVLVPPPPSVEYITLDALLASCDKHPAAPLVFSYDGRPIQPGYHVTEVKAGAFAALTAAVTPRPGRRSSFSSGISLKATAPTCSLASSPQSSARSPSTWASTPARASPSRSATAWRRCSFTARAAPPRVPASCPFRFRPGRQAASPATAGLRSRRRALAAVHHRTSNPAADSSARCTDSPKAAVK